MKKSLLSLLSVMVVGALAACDFGGSQSGDPVNVETANTTMMRAMANMSNMSIGSFEISLETDTSVSMSRDVEENEYGWYDETGSIIVDGGINVKVSDLWGTAPKAHLNVAINEASVVMSDTNDGEYINVSLTDDEVNAYYDNEFAYIDLSAATSLLDLMFDGEVPAEFPTKLKAPVGSVDQLEIPDMTDPTNALGSSESDEMIAEMLPMLMLMPNVTATSVGNEIRIVYQLTQADLPDLIESFILAMASSMGELPSSIDSSMQAELDAMVAEVLEVIDLTTFRIEVRIDTTRNILTYFQIDVDVEITIEDMIWDGYYNESTYEWVQIEIPYTQVVDIDTTTTLQILKFSEPVTVTLPTDLDTYVNPDEEV
jgi:hypothetical protein